MGQAVSYILKSTSEKRSNKQNLQISPIIQWATSLRKAVSYILKSISGKRSNKQKLHTSPIIQWVKSHYCLHVVLFSMALLAIKFNSCSNSKTRSNHISRLVSLSRDISNDQALLNEILVDPSDDVPSTDEALLPKLTTTPSAVFRSIDQFKVTDSNIQVVEDKKQLHPPNNENVKTTKARSGEERKEAKPRERVALLPNLTTTPSAVFQSIDQFKVTDSNIQVVEDKKQLHPPNNENVKTTKARSGEERKEAKPRERVALPVVIERRIKHYSSSQKILLVGEGDFSFSACLAKAFGSASNIVATSLNSSEFLRANYSNAMSNICELRIQGGNVMHHVDATEMARNCLINDSVYDRIIYNFPHDGFFKNEPREMQLKRHRGLVAKFFENAKELISADGEIHISHKSNGFFLEWNLQLLASNVGLRLTDEVPFDLNDYKGYNTKLGDGGDRNFDCNPSKTYKFGFKTRKTAI